MAAYAPGAHSIRAGYAASVRIACSVVVRTAHGSGEERNKWACHHSLDGFPVPREFPPLADHRWLMPILPGPMRTRAIAVNRNMPCSSSVQPPLSLGLVRS